MKIKVIYESTTMGVALVNPRTASANRLRRKLARVESRPRLKYLGEDDLTPGPGDDVLGEYLAEHEREMRELEERSY